MHELVYTSAPKGLKPGSQGFCTVACSSGLPPNLLMRLEALSGYRSLVPPGQHAAGVYPVVYSYLVVRVGGADWHVLSRIADAGVDYTQRSNKIAHHIAFEPSELPPAGPAALLACESRFFRSWDGEPKLIMKPAPFPQVQSQPQICKYWEQVTGDAGWGGVLAETAREDRQVILVVMHETDTISLFAESLALLPPELRWQMTLTTCRPAPVNGAGQTTQYTWFPGGISCRWCCVIAGSLEMSQIRLSPDTMVIDLTQPLKSAVLLAGVPTRPNNIPVPTPLVKAARSGTVLFGRSTGMAAFINAGNIAELSAALDAESRQDKTTPDRYDNEPNEKPGVAVPIAKAIKTPKKSKKRKRSKQDRLYGNNFHDNKTAAADLQTAEKRQDKWGLFVLLGLGLLFFGVPAWLIVMLIFAKGCQ